MGTVRHATAADIPQLVALGRVMLAEAPALKHAPYNAAKVGAAIETAMQIGLVLVHETDGAIDGAFAGVVVERWFSSAKMLADLALFVHPGRRGSASASLLVQTVKAWAAERKLDTQLAITTGLNADATGEFYERMGFERIGGIYQLRSA